MEDLYNLNYDFEYHFKLVKSLRKFNIYIKIWNKDQQIILWRFWNILVNSDEKAGKLAPFNNEQSVFNTLLKHRRWISIRWA